MVFSQQDVNNMFLYNDETSSKFSIRLVRFLFQMVPSFTFSNVFGVIEKTASTHLDPQSIIWVDGRKYGWDDFMAHEKGTILIGVSFTMPSAFEMYLTLIGDVFLYLALAWYFDHVVSHNRGVAE